MSGMNIDDLRQRLIVHDNCGSERPGVAERLNIWCELNRHHGLTCRMSLGYESGPNVQRSLNDTTVLFLEIGKALGIDVVALVEQLADSQSKETENEN